MQGLLCVRRALRCAPALAALAAATCRLLFLQQEGLQVCEGQGQDQIMQEDCLQGVLRVRRVMLLASARRLACAASAS